MQCNITMAAFKTKIQIDTASSTLENWSYQYKYTNHINIANFCMLYIARVSISNLSSAASEPNTYEIQD